MDTALHSPAEQALIATAERVLPAGSFGNMPGDLVIREGRGSRVWDESGREYVDFLLGSGPMLVGHAHPEVTAAVQAQVALGTTFFANNRHGIRLAEAIVAAVPCAEQIRFVSTGSEADLYAMRAARAYTKRDKILKFEGGYHGMSDYSLMSLAPKRPGNLPRAIPDSAGIPASVRDEMVIAPFNDIDATAGLVREHKSALAAVIVEPFQRIIPPTPGFLADLRTLTAEHGIPLIFDEVVTGFRLAYGGAQEYYGVTPDLCSLGKVIGGGFPLAAIAGKAEIMAHFDQAKVGDDGFLKQIGTLSGNPVAAVAGLACLEILHRPGAYETIFKTGRALMQSLDEKLKRAGIPAQVLGEPPCFDVVFTTTTAPIRNYRDMLTADPALTRRFNALVRERGILKSEQKYYVSLAHTPDDVRVTQDAWDDAIEQLTKERSRG
ncbi:MAG TPA: aminotransferase class III-fold pyridoxal phosphate-dependent enzyme [Candidatus Sulfotelmatobacter sp.]|nr:aminotransferase class III-fold pyridoxal phosphate-dependent enzyme [Candidatus Sulfotelmatobacter sp.]